jgi:hypothetical protein
MTPPVSQIDQKLGAEIGLMEMPLNFVKASPFEFSRRRIGLVDGPLTDEVVMDVCTA